MKLKSYQHGSHLVDYFGFFHYIKNDIGRIRHPDERASLKTSNLLLLFQVVKEPISFVYFWPHYLNTATLLRDNYMSGKRALRKVYGFRLHSCQKTLCGICTKSDNRKRKRMKFQSGFICVKYIDNLHE